MGRGTERKIVQNAIFHGNRHDNKILKVNILLSRNFVFMAQAPTLAKAEREIGGIPCASDLPGLNRNKNYMKKSLQLWRFLAWQCG